MQVIHRVKSWTMFFMGIIDGTRTSDIRLDDRRYCVGDILMLHEFDPVKQEYTGRVQDATITYIQKNKSNPCAISHDAIKDGYAVLSIKTVGNVLHLKASEIQNVTVPRSA